MQVKFVPLPKLYSILGNLATELIAVDAPPVQRDLREHGQKKTKEMHQAALFARVIQGAFEVEPTEMLVGFPEDEYCDHDAVLLWKKEEKVTQLKVQLKELPPANLNPKVTIEEIINRVVTKLPRSPDVLVAIFVNRSGGAQKVNVPHHGLAGFCAYGFTGLHPQTIFVVGYIGETRIEATVPLKLLND